MTKALLKGVEKLTLIVFRDALTFNARWLRCLMGMLLAGAIGNVNIAFIAVMLVFLEWSGLHDYLGKPTLIMLAGVKVGLGIAYLYASLVVLLSATSLVAVKIPWIVRFVPIIGLLMILFLHRSEIVSGDVAFHPFLSMGLLMTMLLFLMNCKVAFDRRHTWRAQHDVVCWSNEGQVTLISPHLRRVGVHLVQELNGAKQK